MEMEESGRTSRRQGRYCYTLLLMLFVAIVTVVILALTSVNVFRVSSSPQKTVLSLRKRFPGHFRSPEEQRRFELELEKVTATSVKVRATFTGTCPIQNCSLGFANATDLRNGSPFIPLVPARSIKYNACCVSRSYYISPTYMEDILGVNRTLAVFDGFRQYFFTENCAQVDGCDYCLCSQSNYLVTGVYVTGPDEYDVSFFSLKGCCKCFNE